MCRAFERMWSVIPVETKKTEMAGTMVRAPVALMDIPMGIKLMRQWRQAPPPPQIHLPCAVYPLMIPVIRLSSDAATSCGTWLRDKGFQSTHWKARVDPHVRLWTLGDRKLCVLGRLVVLEYTLDNMPMGMMLYRTYYRAICQHVLRLWDDIWLVHDSENIYDSCKSWRIWAQQSIASVLDAYVFPCPCTWIDRNYNCRLCGFNQINELRRKLCHTYDDDSNWVDVDIGVPTGSTLSIPLPTEELARTHNSCSSVQTETVMYSGCMTRTCMAQWYFMPSRYSTMRTWLTLLRATLKHDDLTWGRWSCIDKSLIATLLRANSQKTVTCSRSVFHGPIHVEVTHGEARMGCAECAVYYVSLPWQFHDVPVHTDFQSWKHRFTTTHERAPFGPKDTDMLYVMYHGARDVLPADVAVGLCCDMPMSVTSTALPLRNCPHTYTRVGCCHATKSYDVLNITKADRGVVAYEVLRSRVSTRRVRQAIMVRFVLEWQCSRTLVDVVLPQINVVLAQHGLPPCVEAFRLDVQDDTDVGVFRIPTTLCVTVTDAQRLTMLFIMGCDSRVEWLDCYALSNHDYPFNLWYNYHPLSYRPLDWMYDVCWLAQENKHPSIMRWEIDYREPWSESSVAVYASRWYLGTHHVMNPDLSICTNRSVPDRIEWLNTDPKLVPTRVRMLKKCKTS